MQLCKKTVHSHYWLIKNTNYRLRYFKVYAGELVPILLGSFYDLKIDCRLVRILPTDTFYVRINNIDVLH